MTSGAPNMWKAVFVVGLVVRVSAQCYDPSPAFPPPAWDDASGLKSALVPVEGLLRDVALQEKFSGSSFSVEVTSATDTLLSTFHAAQELNASRPGDQNVDGRSVYRIASITKVFTTLALLYQHDAGTLHLDDPVSKYIAELDDSDSGGAIPWKDISLRSLASQLSGIPREFSFAEVLGSNDDPTAIGLPPASKDYLPACLRKDPEAQACSRSDLVEQLKKDKPVFTPHQMSYYSNLGFNILGLVLENVTGKPYVDYIDDAIFKPLGMHSSTFETPSDKHAVLPIGDNYWDIQQGIQNPTGGIYSSSADMSVFLRYVLTHFNTLGGLNWLMPASWAPGVNSFYGMPWELFRTDKILKESQRPVTFATKGGGLPGYFSKILVLEEYGLGITILVSGSQSLLKPLQEIVSVELVRAAERLTWEAIDKTYSGNYTSTNPDLKSSVGFTSSPSKGLHLSAFISNSTDVLHDVMPSLANSLVRHSGAWHGQLIPTLLFKNESSQQGEIWRLLIVPERVDGAESLVWDDHCITDIDPLSYAGLPLNEVVFWHEDKLVEMPAWNLTAKKTSKTSSEEEKLVIQV